MRLPVTFALRIMVALPAGWSNRSWGITVQRWSLFNAKCSQQPPAMILIWVLHTLWKRSLWSNSSSSSSNQLHPVQHGVYQQYKVTLFFWQAEEAEPIHTPERYLSPRHLGTHRRKPGFLCRLPLSNGLTVSLRLKEQHVLKMVSLTKRAGKPVKIWMQ